jgi:purine-binding chemotaxis protein CheW
MKKPDSNTPRNTGFDWPEIRKRLAASTAAISFGEEVTQEEMERIWAERAAVLAEVPVEEAQGERIEVALVRLGHEVFGLPVQNVLDVWPAQRITQVPRTPEWVAGVTNLHGRIISIVNLRLFFGLPAAENDPETKQPSYLVVVTIPPMETALLVDEVIGVESLQVSAGEKGVLHGLPMQYVHKLVKLQQSDQLALVLNLPALFADERFVIREELS